MKRSIKQKIFLLCALFFSRPLMAGEAIVIATEAPLLKDPQWDAQVVEYKYKGEKFYLHDEYFNPEKPQVKPEDFLKTIDGNGAIAYIPTAYVKLIYKDQREASEVVSLDQDPTYDRKQLHFQPELPPDVTNFNHKFALMLGQGTASPYRYNQEQNIIGSSASFGTSLQAHYLKRGGDSKELKPYFFGTQARLATTQYDDNYENGVSSSQRILELGIGPMLSYELIQRSNYQLVFGGGFNFIYRQITVENTSGDILEQRQYNGLMIMPMTTLQWHTSKLFANVGLVVGANMHLVLPQRLSNKEEAEYPELWNQNDRDWAQAPINAQIDLFVGLQSRF